MRVYNCIVVDDEPLARKVLEDYTGMLPGLKMVAMCKNAGEAIAAFHQCQIDIVFCDIEMPGINGLQLISSLSYTPKVIITSAYSEYAVTGFTLGVTDYLLKPIALDRFLLAVNRAMGHIGQLPASEATLPANEFVFFKTSTSSERVYLSNIDYIEACGNYSRLHLLDTDRKLLVNHKISGLDTELGLKHFVRVHKSYIVNQEYVSKVSSSTVFLGKTEIPIGESFKKAFLDLIQLKCK